MKLPRGDRAIISHEKVLRYLLAVEHPEGGGKARFFLARGYVRDRPEELERSLQELALRGEVIETIRTRHGTKHVVEGIVETPDGRRARLRSVWIAPPDDPRPRFVTAYPTR